ncbi:MAG: hypothetical protein MJ195_02765 [Mycoplasmoidaceae bacterium]|nr:hypothetical protein [Mycoplasmoidaceae bacterium]
MRTRKNKIILGSLIAASSIGTIAPIVSMTSCSKDNTSTTGNLMSEYNPESAQLPESAVSN